MLCGIISVVMRAQQDPNFSIYFFNPINFNPGYVGSREVYSGSLVHRSQWIAIPDAPTTQSLNFHHRVPNSRIGVGLHAHNDMAGPWRNTGFGLTFAYHIPFTKTAHLSFGLTGVMNNVHIKFEKIKIEDQSDPSFANNGNSKWVPDASAGLYFYTPNFYFGLSSTHMIENFFHFTKFDGADFSRFYRHYYLTTGGLIPLGEKFGFRPSALVKYTQAAPLVKEIDGTLVFFHRFFLGAGYRTAERIGEDVSDNIAIAFVEIKITNSLRIGYSFDNYLTRDAVYNSGTHEFLLGWDISGRARSQISSPRYF